VFTSPFSQPVSPVLTDPSSPAFNPTMAGSPSSGFPNNNGNTAVLTPGTFTNNNPAGQPSPPLSNNNNAPFTPSPPPVGFAPNSEDAFAAQQELNHTGMIIGIVIGVIFALLLIIGLVVFLMRRRRRQPPPGFHPGGFGKGGPPPPPPGGPTSPPPRGIMRTGKFSNGPARSPPATVTMAPAAMESTTPQRQRAPSSASASPSQHPPVVGMVPVTDASPKDREHETTTRKTSAVGQLHEVRLVEEVEVIDATVVTQEKQKTLQMLSKNTSRPSSHKSVEI